MLFPWVSLGQDCSEANSRRINLHQESFPEIRALEHREKKHKHALNVLNALSHSSDQVTGFFWSLQVKAVRGAAIVAN